MSNVAIKREDDSITFTDTLSNGGSTVDLTGSAILFMMEHTKGGARYSAAASIVTAASGTVSFGGPLPSGFPTKVGEYKQHWKVTFPDDSTLTFPSDSFNSVYIGPSI